MEESLEGNGSIVAGSQRNPNAANPPGTSENVTATPNRPAYSIPGILHFIQHEWARFEIERAQWEVERAELQARIAFLQGERKGQENLKRDLIRRIKMLEFALRQERQKLHKLKYGTELKFPEEKEDADEEEVGVNAGDAIISKNHDLMFNYRQGRQLLRQYLQEIGFTDKVLEMRSARLHSLLGVTTDNQDQQSNSRKTKGQGQAGDSKATEDELENEERVSPPHSHARNDAGKQKSDLDEIQPVTDKPHQPLDSLEFLQQDENLATVTDSETGEVQIVPPMMKLQKREEEVTNSSEIMKNFDFLHDESSTDDSSTTMDAEADEWQVDSGKLQQRIKQFKSETKDRGKKMKRPNRQALHQMLETFGGTDEEDIPPPPSGPTPQVPVDLNSMVDVQVSENMGDVPLPSTGFAVRSGPHPEPNAVEVSIGLGDLAGLTVSNEASPMMGLDGSNHEEVRKAWSPKYTLRSHFDGVRSICFHPYESALITASEDHTLKLWSLQKNVPGKKGNISDLEPVYTFRGHTGPALCAIINSNGSMCYSGGQDATIQCWHLPSLNIELFGPYHASLAGETLVSHTDAVWDLAYQIDTDRLLSCSADGTCKLWNPNPLVQSPLLESYKHSEEAGNPTSVSFISTDTGQMATSYSNNEFVIFDMETAQVIKSFTPEKSPNVTHCQINKLISHPALNMVITAHEDRYIRFFDVNSGKEVHNMVAHLDAVTSLSVDPSGLYILSGSHDGSIRLWNMENKTCIQEITAHRKKFDEAVFDVAFHPTQPYIASAGADALAKVFA